ncbi:MAG: ArsA family ATPase [Pseudomonadota bacterium]|nr:ArsA family ATPase [Pseudomonadota bacterium]
MLLRLARERRLLLVGGKGGVGKTTIAAATALAMAREGRRVLLVSTDPAHNLGHLWGRSIGPDPVRVEAGLDAVELDPQAVADAHLDSVGRELRRLMPPHLAGEVDKHLALSREAPGLHEAALLEKLAQTIEGAQDSHDLVVVDTAPSGHTARLLALPEMMAAWTDGLLLRRERAERFTTALSNLGAKDVEDRVFGGGGESQTRDQRIRQVLLRRRQRFERLRERLSDAAATAFVIVLTAERLPVLETIELHAQLRKAGLAAGGLVINKRSPRDAGGFLAERWRQESLHLDALRQQLPDLERLELPLMPNDLVGAEALAALSVQFAGA